ncbi:unnamed protein product [Paramecium primaurelia]|uniref:Protein kinase domain-containing protein n=1 Tax=Paramecium primaurelia TaxID=5886 RepID=A0A8S1KKQ4_PARPR|nr:unnamed protein product [Paramecium primaurelia]
MGVQQSNINENIPFLSNKKMIMDKGNFQIYENDKNQKFDYKEFKSTQNSFQNELEVAREIQNQNFTGMAKIEDVIVQTQEKWFTKYFTLCILIEHPKYSLKEYKQKNDKTLSNQQITELLVSITQAQHILGMKKQYLSLDNIFTNDGNVWKLRPFFDSESSYYNLMRFKQQNIVNFQLDGFPAPEEFFGYICDTDRVQVFNLGMIILELITKQKSNDIYKEYKVDETLLQQRIQSMLKQKNQFCGNFIDIIIEMLDTDSVRRPNFEQLLKKLKSPSSQIVYLQTKINFVKEIPKLNLLDSINLFEESSLNKYDEAKLSKALQQAKIEISDYIIKTKQELQNIKNAQTKLDKNGQKYHGQIVNNVYEGKGYLFSKSGDLIYEGEFSKGYFHGWGVEYHQNSIQLEESYNFEVCQDIMEYFKKYEGCYQFGKKSGVGRLILTNGEIFCGEFRNDQINGFGEFQNKSNNKIIGIWNNGLIKSNSGLQNNLISFRSDEFQNQTEQLQIQIQSNQQQNQGDQKVNKPEKQFNGISNLESCRSFLEQSTINHLKYFNQNQSQNRKDHKIFYDDANTILKYEGQLFTGQMHGRGTLYFKNGTIQYEGDFVNGKYEGYGILKNENPQKEMNINYNDLRDVNIKGWWEQYQGTFSKGEKQGQGYWHLTDNSVLLGMFEKDEVHGDGYLKRPNQEDFYAQWENGILHKVLQGKL